MHAMTDTRSRYDRVVSTLSRRQAIAGGATLLTAGGTLVWVGGGASAQVSVESLDIADASFEAESIDPVVDIEASYRYDIGTQPIKRVELALSVGDTEVVTESLLTSRTTADGTESLQGRVADSDAWALADFAVAVGESVEHTLSVTLTMTVVDRSGETIISDKATDEVVVSVAHPQANKWTAGIGGSGVVRTESE